MTSRSTPFQLAAGIDFGTAFTKVMVRNTTTDELFAVSFPQNGKDDFILPSILFLKDGQLTHPVGQDSTGFTAVIPYLKMALAEKCRGFPEQWGTLVARSNGATLPYALDDYIEALVGCFLVGVVGHIQTFSRSKWPDFGAHPQDKIFYQMSIPAEDVQHEAVLGLFKKCLFWAVDRAESGQQEPSLPEIQTAIHSHPGREDCLFLAEVTANVLTYRLSRAGRPGLYLFVDVGAGTVDLSVFLYPEPKYFEQQQNYAAARVSFTGSSHIELRALGSETSQNLLSELRACKEGASAFGQHQYLIDAAKRSLVEELENVIRATLGDARKRFVPNQFRTLEVLVGGGGWCDVPYLRAVKNAVQAFRLDPKPYPLPQPENAKVIWGSAASRFAPRFSVAHGLSHPFWTWPQERYPGDPGEDMGPIEPTLRTQRPINPAHESDG